MQRNEKEATYEYLVQKNELERLLIETTPISSRTDSLSADTNTDTIVLRYAMPFSCVT